MLRFFLIFMSLLTALFALRISAFGEEHITGPFTGLLAAISVWIVTLFDSNVISYGKIIASSVNGFAVEIAPDFGVNPDPMVIKIANESKRLIKRINTPDPVMTVDPAIATKRGTWNIVTGGY